TGRDDDGVGLVSPGDPAFDTLARPMLGRLADAALRLKPYMVIVANRAPRTVVAFAVTWETRRRAGRLHTSRVQFKCPDAVCGRSPVRESDCRILPHDMTVVADGCSVSPESLECGDLSWLDQFVEEKRRLSAEAIDLHIEIDALIFDDGTLVGYDFSGV